MAPQLKVPVSKPKGPNSTTRNHVSAKESSGVTKLSSDLHVTVTTDSHTNNVFKVNREKKALEKTLRHIVYFLCLYVYHEVTIYTTSWCPYFTGGSTRAN